jgi:hypothetical protein
MDRKPKQIVLYIELEDNVGAVLAKRKVEVPVEFTKLDMMDDATVRKMFDEFCDTQLPEKLNLP